MTLKQTYLHKGWELYWKWFLTWTILSWTKVVPSDLNSSEWALHVPGPGPISLWEDLKKNLENYRLKPLLWLWFVNDIFLIWTDGKQELTNFVEYANYIAQSISPATTA